MSSRKYRSARRAIQSQHPASVISPDWLLVLSGVALIAGISVFVYLPSLRGEFIIDDDMYLTDNSMISSPSGLLHFWTFTQPWDFYPVSNSSLWMEWRLWGMDPTGYRVTNLLLHIATALLVWRLLWRLGIPAAFLAALLFAVHPVNVEAVAWIAQRKDMLAVALFLISILCYLRGDDAHASIESESVERTKFGWAAGRWYWLSLLAFALAMLSKGTVAILPLVLLWILWWRRPLRLSDVARAVPFFAVAALFTVVNIYFQTFGFVHVIRTATFTERLLGAGAAIWFYVAKACFPVELSFVYPLWHVRGADVRWWLPLLAAVVVTVALWRQREDRRGRSLLFAWGFFCIALVPLMGFTDVGFMEFSLVADHYQHIALIGAVALASAGWANWRGQARSVLKPAITALAAAAAVAALALLSLRQSYLFANPITLYSDTLVKNPGCAMIRNNLGLALADRGRFDGAVEQLQQALRLHPNYPEAHNNLGTTLAKSGRPLEAIEQFQKAIELKPDYSEPHFNLGLIFAAQNRPDEAIREYQEALKLQGDYAEAHNGLGIELARQGRLQEAIEHLQSAVELKPYYVEAHNNLGVVLARIGRTKEAIEQYQQALRLKPDFADARSNLDNALQRIQQNALLHPAPPSGVESK